MNEQVNNIEDVPDLVPSTSSPPATVTTTSRPSRSGSRPRRWRVTTFEEKTHTYPERPVCVVRSPISYLQDYFDDNFYELVSKCTNLYYLRKTGRELKTSKAEIMKLFGMHILMGCIPYPRLPMYWRAGISLDKIVNAMSRDRFIQLRNALHVVSSDTAPQEQSRNPLWKVQPMIDHIRNGCYKQERVPSFYSIDEQMIPFTGRCPLRQVVKNKPRPVGLKNYVLTTSDGLLLDFDIYQGAKTMFGNTTLGLGPSIVLHLSRSIPPNSCVYHDRHFTTIPLIEEMQKRNLHSTGTIMFNRVPDRATLKFKKDSQMSRGECQQMVREPAVLVKWKENKSVLIASNCTGSDSTEVIKRWDKKMHSYINVTAPKVIQNYNKYMGGVDVLDQQIEYYRTFIKTRKWTLKVLIHFMDLALVNTWRAYKINCTSNQFPRKKTMELLDFRLEISDILLSTPQKRRGESAVFGDEIENIMPKKFKKALRPPDALRHDGYDHLPHFDDLKSPRFCQLETCKSRTKTRCLKCNVYLCISRGQNCFQDYHKV